MTCLCKYGCNYCRPPVVTAELGPCPVCHAERKAEVVVGYVLRSPGGKMLRWSDETGTYYANASQPDLFVSQSQAIKVLGAAIEHFGADSDDGVVSPQAMTMVEWLLTCRVTKLVTV